MTSPILTPRRKPTRVRRLRGMAAMTVLAATLAATGCSVLPADTGSQTHASQSTATDAPSAAAASLARQADAAQPATGSAVPVPPPAAPKDGAKPTPPSSAAEALSKKVKASLTALGNTTKSPSRDQMKQAMLDAGAAKGKVEVSIDRTPTGLAVDAIEAAAPVEKDCVIGQVRNGGVEVTVLPLLASGRCFIGDQR